MVTTSPLGLTDLPGLELPLDHHERLLLEQLERYDDHGYLYFPNALIPEYLNRGGGRAGMPLLTVREITMLQIMQQITNKKDWDVKVRHLMVRLTGVLIDCFDSWVWDDNITAKWRSEAMQNTAKDVTERMVDYIIAELRHKAEHFAKTSSVVAYDFVTISDYALPKSFKEELNHAVRILEDIPDNLKDWHPGSNGTVLDLVHPSLFPLVYGRTRALENGVVPLTKSSSLCGQGKVVPVPFRGDSSSHFARYPRQSARSAGLYSQKYQWLPCEVDISGPDAKVTTYINNLHPTEHKPLYHLVEQVIEASIPLWNSTLTLVNQRGLRSGGRIRYKGSYVSDVESIVLPEPEPFQQYVPADPKAAVDLREAYAGLQVIVKLSNIELTPETPEYAGGSWHVEGQLNEHICATALYYYSNENITASTLAFRQQCNTCAANETSYPQDFHDWVLLPVYGLTTREPAIQVLGGVKTTEGRLLTFPNILQHQVQPFKLVDPTKKGHRKILALFLVDPAIKIISTANVPCQRLDWWSDEVCAQNSSLSHLPRELKDKVFGQVEDFPISMDDAKKLRLELMEERKTFEVRQDTAFKSAEFSLCEH